MRKLAADQRADPDDHGEGEHHHDNDGKHAIDVPTAQQQHRWPERETQQEGEGHRDKDFPPDLRVWGPWSSALLPLQRSALSRKRGEPERRIG